MARKPPVCIDLTQDLAFVKDRQHSTNSDQVAKDVCMPANNPIHPTESYKKSAAFPDPVCDTRRQVEHSASMGVSESFTDHAMEVLVSEDPVSLPGIPSRSEERREPVAVSKHTPVTDRSNRVEDSMTEPRDAMLSSPSVSAHQRRPRVSFASPLVTRPNCKDTFQVSSMGDLTPDVLSNSHSRIDAHTHEVMHPPVDRGISLVSDDEIESPHPMRNPSTNRVRSGDIGSRSSSFLKTNSNPVWPSGTSRDIQNFAHLIFFVVRSVQSQPEKRAKNSPRDNSCYNTKSDEFNDIQDIVNVRKDCSRSRCAVHSFLSGVG